MTAQNRIMHTTTAPAAPTSGRLGDLSVRRMGYGAMQLAGPGVLGPPEDPELSREVLRRAVALGVDHIDTAQFYGPEVVNTLIREALHPYPDDLRLVTKVGARRDAQGAWLPDADPASLVAQVEQNLRTLGAEQLAMVNLRRFDLDHPDLEQPALEDQLEALAGLRQKGLIQHIGVSAVRADQVRRAVQLAGAVSVQNPYSIVDRSGEDVLEAARDLGIAFVPYFPLGSAFTSGPARIAEDPVIRRVAQRHGASSTQIALAWLLHRYENLLLIPGTGSVDHLEQNHAAGRIGLDADDLAELAGVPQVSSAG